MKLSTSLFTLFSLILSAATGAIAGDYKTETQSEKTVEPSREIKSVKEEKTEKKKVFRIEGNLENRN
jgi:hypothetical protein